jgi:chromosome segregation ATPase
MQDDESVAEPEGRRKAFRILLRIAIVLVLILAGTSVGLVYGNYQLGKERKAHQEKINEANKKAALIQKKSSEERDLRSSLESQKRALTGEVEKLKKENAALVEEIKKIEGGALALETQFKNLAEEYSRVKAARDETSAQLAQVVQIAKDLESEVKRLTIGKQTLEASLSKVNQDLDRCRACNGKLCIIGEEILARERKPRGLVSTIVQNEPFTQLKKVELEKIAQEYQDKIDQERLKTK